MISDSSRSDSRPPAATANSTMGRYEVTVLTTRTGTIVVVVGAPDRAAALNMVREELASGDLTAPPEHCTDDVQTEIWAVRQLVETEVSW